ncbi:PAS domain S-box-containing protein/diguanylate cyclase (GGDEF) domain-containing protein [Rheinheimera pacifica]|uniref:cyclic-guanylate-specific phosphodiesterase n=1 Tax=Rheinheimera pacifica TaxID=173990 RepID=A0A1H6MNN4_9GAMM|nr:EAL domain-containing protein [Rheinheimera pacifica]SEI01070.1 PAS domain S-box-containing protein/diguanylate cyclase (GGDEF) domain-containing protein [Rheinheimera pacifica]
MNFVQPLMRIAALFLMLAVFNLAAAPLLRPLTPDQGLTQGSVNDLLLDQEGFLWLATEGGLNRFDSNHVVQVGTAVASLKEISFTRLLQDNSGSIFAATATGDLYRFNRASGYIELAGSLRQQNDQTNSTFITGMASYNSDSLLLSTHHAVFRLSLTDGSHEKLFDIRDAGYSNGWLRNIEYYQGYALIAAFNGVIAVNLSNNQHQHLPYLDSSIVSDDRLHSKLLSIKHNRLWIGTVDGLYSINLDDMLAYLQHQKPYQAKTELASLNIWQLKWIDDHVLIPTERGLYRFYPQRQSTEFVLRFSDANLGLFENTIIDIVADKAGGYWLASRDNGAYYWHPRSQAFSQIVRTDNDNTTLSSNVVYSLLASDSQTLWIGTANGLNKNQLHNGTNTSYLVNPDPKAIQHDGTIYAIYPADNHNLWLVNANGLRLFDTATASLQIPSNIKESDKHYLNARNSSYFLYQQQWYFFYDTKLMRYTPANGTVEDISSDFSASSDSRGTILGVYTGKSMGLLVAKPDEIWLWQPQTNSQRLIYQAPGYQPMLGRIANSMQQDKQGRLWISMSGVGLLGFATDTLELLHFYSVDDTLLSDAVYNLQLDAHDDIWFSSHYGLARLDTNTLQIEFFTRDDGIYTHEYNGGAVTTLADGRLAFGSMRGVTLVDPARLQQQSAEPSVIITSLSLLSGNFKPVNTNLNERHFSLSHKDLGITLQFSAMNFSNQHKMRYRYWLEGKQNINYPPQRGNSVIFPQLSSGDYTFNVVAISPESGTESAPAKIQLHIKPAFWLSGWALLSYAALLTLLMYKVYRLRRHQHALLRSIHNKALLSEQRLKQALASVNSGAWEWQADTNLLFASRIHSMLGYNESMNPLTLQQHQTLIHPDDREGFSTQWARFLQQPEQGFDFTYRMQHQSGNWLWFRDLGKATEHDIDNSVTKVIGTFSNITETRANQEKARLFGEAFQQTRDWVVILDNSQRVIAANQSFADAFGSVEQYLDQPRTHHLGISLVRRRFYTRLLKEMKPGQHWQGEELVITPDGRERPTLINVSAIGEQQELAFFVLVFTDITAQKIAEDELRYLANYDALTGLPNRALLMDRIYHGIDQAKRDKRSLALCFIDLDKFKQINDSLGHDVGDLLLKEVARRLTLTLRDSDTVARLGGDEFIVLLEGYKTADNISHVARKMLTVVSEPMQLGTHTVGVSPSIGIAIYPDDAINAIELLKHADVAMYHAKEAGRNNFQFFTAEMNEKAHMRLARETRLRKALQNDEFINFYQPIVNSQTRQVVGAEVLIRWQSSEGLISPADFIPLAEELRLIINMTHQLLERALSDLRQWHQDGYQLYLSVNLSTQHLEQPALVEHTRFLLQKYQVPANCLRFEVTESALMRDHQSAIDTMQALSELGVQLALDDFGTGYSSLKYLKELPIDGIKIDRSFVQDIGIDSSDETIIEAMLSMANSLGMYCVAEGVETEQQLAFFNRRQCYLIQGYLFAKPMPAADIPAFLQTEL